jgi:hypothetical protein
MIAPMRSIVATAALLASSIALAQPAEDHASRGYQLAADGQLEAALTEFAAAYRATREPQLLFAMGRIHALRGDCVRANDHFQRFLATQPGPKAVEAATAEIAKCKPAPIAIAPEPPAPDPVVAVGPSPPPTVAHPARRSFTSALAHDRFAQVGAVAALATGGLVVYGLYLSCWDGVCTGSYDDFAARQDRAPTVAVAAGVVGAAAGALLVTGIVRVALRPDDEAGFDVSVAPTPGGAAVGIAGAF